MVSAPMRHNKTLVNFSREPRYFASSEKLSVLIEAVQEMLLSAQEREGTTKTATLSF